MRCECKSCRGEGVIEIECGECGGSGSINVSILHQPPAKGSKHYDALIELHYDAHQVVLQCEKLKAMNPAHAESYERQLSETLEKLNQQAAEMLK
jgi:RecJ-like exonuclease